MYGNPLSTHNIAEVFGLLVRKHNSKRLGVSLQMIGPPVADDGGNICCLLQDSGNDGSANDLRSIHSGNLLGLRVDLVLFLLGQSVAAEHRPAAFT
jgi:hypothetical protein